MKRTFYCYSCDKLYTIRPEVDMSVEIKLHEVIFEHDSLSSI